MTNDVFTKAWHKLRFKEKIHALTEQFEALLAIYGFETSKEKIGQMLLELVKEKQNDK